MGWGDRGRYGVRGEGYYGVGIEGDNLRETIRTSSISKVTVTSLS